MKHSSLKVSRLGYVGFKIPGRDEMVVHRLFDALEGRVS